MTEQVLTVTELIGSGLHRDCWVHPHDPGLCVKTSRVTGRGCYQSEADVFNFARLERKGLVGIHVPRIYGWAPTNRGRGLVSERVLDECGTPSPTLAKAVRGKLISTTEAERLVHELFHKLLSLNIVVRDTGPLNMLLRYNETHGRHLVMVDGVGHTATGVKELLRDALPILGRYRTKKEFKITKKRLVKLFASIPTDNEAPGGAVTGQRRAA